MTGERLTHPIAEARGLRDAAAHVVQRRAADNSAVRGTKNEKRVSEIGLLVARVALQTAPKCGAGEIVFGLRRIRRREEASTLLAKARPSDVIYLARLAQKHSLAFDRWQGIRPQN